MICGLACINLQQLTTCIFSHLHFSLNFSCTDIIGRSKEKADKVKVKGKGEEAKRPTQNKWQP
jgi:hypothetical protein